MQDIYISKYMSWESGLNFLRELKFIKEVNLRIELALDIEDTYIYDFALRATNDT